MLHSKNKVSSEKKSLSNQLLFCWWDRAKTYVNPFIVTVPTVKTEQAQIKAENIFDKIWHDVSWV